jgi:hypothetical protein
LKSCRSQKLLYAERARKRFCKGTCFIAPVDLVLSGQRTLEDWTAVLEKERELDHLNTVKSTRTRARRSKVSHLRF